MFKPWDDVIQGANKCDVSAEVVGVEESAAVSERIFHCLMFGDLPNIYRSLILRLYHELFSRFVSFFLDKEPAYILFDQSDPRRSP